MRIWRIRDWCLAAALTAGALWEGFVAPLGETGYLGNPAVNTVASVLVIVPVLLRRSYPLIYAAAVTVGVTLLWSQNRGEAELPFIGYSSSLLVSYSIGAHLPRRDALMGGAVTFAAWGVPDVLDAQAELPSIHQDLGFYVLVSLALAAGIGARALRAQSAALARALDELAAERASREALVAAEERHRIARDMHDVLTHTLSALAVQAGALRLRLSQGPEADAARELEVSAREGMQELRRLLGLLREESGLVPSPGLEDIDLLCGPLVATGVKITVQRRGPSGSVPPGPALAAYRLVQESLTNIAKHAPEARFVTISLERNTSGLNVTVIDDGPAPQHWMPGQGLTGMRSRVAAYGGRLDVGPCPTGAGWRVHGALPL